MRSIYLKAAVATVLMGVTALAFGKGPPEGKGPPTGEEAGNNLSVPALLVNGGLSAASGCADDVFAGAVAPSGDPASGYELEGNWYVQGVHEWQAACRNVVASPDADPPVLQDVYGAWGDNLSGDAKLKVGSPIRVEIVLYEGDAGTSGMAIASVDGYPVLKLETSKLDRESAYGTAAFTDDGGATYHAMPESMTPVVYDADARLIITRSGAAEPFVDEAIAPEINATGKVVYGYNLRVTELGTWVITFTMPNLNFVGCDIADTCSGHTAALPITVVGGGGSGGGKPNR